MALFPCKVNAGGNSLVPDNSVVSVYDFYGSTTTPGTTREAITNDTFGIPQHAGVIANIEKYSSMTSNVKSAIILFNDAEELMTNTPVFLDVGGTLDLRNYKYLFMTTTGGGFYLTE